MTDAERLDYIQGRNSGHVWFLDEDGTVMLSKMSAAQWRDLQDVPCYTDIRDAIDAAAVNDPSTAAPHEEILRVRIVHGQNGYLALCTFPGEPEFVQQYFVVKVHADPDGGPTMEFSRPKDAIRTHGRLSMEAIR